MADINDLGDIQNNFEHISEVLDSMRAQNAMNAGDVDKALTSINTRLETLVDEDNAEFINVFLADLKRNLEERHNFVSSKFTEIENSFKNLVDTASKGLTADEMKQIFDIIATNLNGFSREVVAQKELLADLSLKMEDLKQDDSAKKDILKNISVLKVEIEKFNNGFESIIVNLNDNFKEVSQTLLKIDSTELLDSVKKDIENIFLSSNAVLSALQVIDRKNRDLEEVLTHVVTKDEFVQEREQVANLISQNIQLTDYISKLPNQDSVVDLSEKVDTAVGVINALKNVLNETSDQNQKMLVAQLENLETKILNISSEEEFVGFKKELSNFAQEVIQSTNLMRADLMNTNSGMKDLLSFLSSLDIKKRFDDLTELTQVAEENIKVNLDQLSERFSRETEDARKMVTFEVNGNVQDVSQKIDSVERNITETSKSNFTNLLENVQSVLANIFTLKNELKAENLESTENLDSKFQELRDGLVVSKDTVIVNAQQNLESLLEGIQTLSGQLELAQDSLEKGSEVNVEKILSTVGKISSEIAAAKQVLSQSAQENLTNILSRFEQLSQELAFSKAAVIDDSSEKFNNLSSNVEKIHQEISDVQRNLGEASQSNLSTILESVYQISQELSQAKEGLTENSKENYENVLSVVDRFSGEINVLKDVLKNSSQESFDNVIAGVDRVSQEILTVQRNLSQVSRENLSSILSSVAQISEELSRTKDELNNSSKECFDNVLVTFEKFSQSVEGLKGDLGANAQSNYENIKSIGEELSVSLASLKGEILLSGKTNAAWLNSTIESLSAEIEAVKEALENKSQVNFENITGRIDEISAKIEGMQEFTSTNLAEHISEVKNAIFTLPAIIRDNQAGFEDEKKVLIEQNSRSIEELAGKIQSLTQGILTKDNSFKESVVNEFTNLTNLLTNAQEYLSDKNTQASEELKLNIKGVESLISGFNTGSEEALHNLEDKLCQYLQLIQDTTQSSDFKLENSIKDVLEIKNDLQCISDGVCALSSDTGLLDLSCEVNKKMEEILFTISQFEEVSSLKEQENLQKTLVALDGQFEKLVENLEEYKNSSNASSSQILDSLTGKISELRDQVVASGTSVSKIVNSRSNEIISGFSPVKEAIDKIAQFDFAAVAFDLKTQLDESCASFTSSIRETMQEDKSEVLERVSQAVSQSFDSISERLENFKGDMSLKTADAASEFKSSLSELSDGIEKIVNMVGVASANFDKFNESNASNASERREFLNGKFETIEAAILASSEKNVRALEETIRGVVEQLQQATSTSDKIDEAANYLKESLSETLEKLENVLVQRQIDSLSDSREEVFEKLSEVKNILLQSQNSLLAGTKQELLERLNRLEEALSQVQQDGQSNLREEVTEKLDRLEASLILNQSDSQYSIIEKIESKLEESALSQKENLDEWGSLKSELLNSIKETNSESLSLIKDGSAEMASLKSELLEEIESIKNALKEENVSFAKESLEEFGFIKAELLEEINRIKTAIQNGNNSFSRESLEELISIKLDILDSIKESKDENASLIKDGSVELASAKEEIVEEISSLKSAIHAENNSFAKESLEELTSMKAELLDGINNVANALQDGSSDKIDSIKSEMGEIIKELNKTQDGIASYKIDIAELLKIKDEDAAGQFSSIENAILEGISENIEDFKATVAQTAEKIEDKLSLSEDTYKTSTQALLTEIKTSFYSKVEDKLDDLKAFMEVLTNNPEYTANIENLKADMFERFSILADDIEKSVSSISVKKDLDTLRTDVETSVNSLLEDLYNRIVLAIEDDKVTQDVLEKSEEITRRVEDLKRTVTEEVCDRLEDFGLSIEKQADDFSNMVSEIKTSLTELKESYIDLSLNSSMEISSLLTTVQEKIENLANKIEGYDFDSIVERATSPLVEKIDSVKEEFAKFNPTATLEEKFDGINTKLDVLAMSSSEDLESDIADIKETIESQGKFIQDLKALERLDKLSKLDSVSSVQEEIKKILSAFDGKLNDISSQKVETKDQSAEIKAELKTLKRELLESVLNVFDQISFVVEAEEIKDFVEEKADEIKSSLGDNFKNILSSLDVLHDKAGGYSDIKSEIVDVKKRLQLIQSGSEESSDYSYTFQDIESDIAKIRLILNEISKSKGDEQREGSDKLSEDIMSISTRTNKLLLTSEESYTTLKANLDEFRNVVYNLEDKVRYLDSTESNQRIEQKVDAVRDLALSSVKSDKTFNQAFMYLAEWVDNASENLGSISENVSDIKEVKQSIAEIKKTVPKKIDLTAILDELSDKFEQQQVQIERLEEKIDLLMSKRSPSSAKVDVDAIAEAVFAKLEENKTDAKMAKKVDSIDKQLAKLGKSIEKLTSYVDVE